MTAVRPLMLLTVVLGGLLGLKALSLADEAATLISVLHIQHPATDVGIEERSAVERPVRVVHVGPVDAWRRAVGDIHTVAGERRELHAGRPSR